MNRIGLTLDFARYSFTGKLLSMMEVWFLSI